MSWGTIVVPSISCIVSLELTLTWRGYLRLLGGRTLFWEGPQPESMVSITQVRVLLDLIVLLVPAIAGAVASWWQRPTDEEPGPRLVRMAYMAAGTLFMLVILHLTTLAEILPRIPMATLYLPYGFVLGYFVHRILVDGQRPQRTESVVLVGISVAATFIIPFWTIARIIGPMLL